jgi:hypothetical protein
MAHSTIDINQRKLSLAVTEIGDGLVKLGQLQAQVRWNPAIMTRAMVIAHLKKAIGYLEVEAVEVAPAATAVVDNGAE